MQFFDRKTCRSAVMNDVECGYCEFKNLGSVRAERPLLKQTRQVFSIEMLNRKFINLMKKLLLRQMTEIRNQSFSFQFSFNFTLN